ncbi:MAG: redoxin domain-containing protein [Vicinamibacteria bacterium]
MNVMLIIRLSIIAVLVTAGLSKLGSGETVTAAAIELGLKNSLARLAGKWLAVAELMIAGLLMLSATAYPAAILALLLFVGFTALIGWNLWQGLTPPCACFGESGGEPISKWTLVRDLVFVGLALTLALGGRQELSHGLVASFAGIVKTYGSAATLGSFLLLGMVHVLVLVALWSKVPGLVRKQESERAFNVPVQAAIEAGWPPGTLAPSFNLPSLDGTRVTLADLIAGGRETVILFTSPDCRPCAALIPEIADWQKRFQKELTIAVVGQGSASVNREKLGEFTLDNVLLQGISEVADAYVARQTPSAVVIGSDRRIARRLATGAVAIRELVQARAAVSPANAPVEVRSEPPPADPFTLVLGELAPPFQLESLRGGTVDLTDFAGRLVLLVFWDAGCSFCRQLAPEIQRWEREQEDGSLPIVFLGRGSRIANESQSFASPFLLDTENSVSQAYGAPGTPSAVLIDADSRLASQVAQGGPRVTALFQRGQVLTRAAWRVEA